MNVIEERRLKQEHHELLELQAASQDKPRTVTACEARLIEVEKALGIYVEPDPAPAGEGEGHEQDHD